MARKRWLWLALLPAALAGCSKSRPGQPTPGGVPALTGAAADGGAAGMPRGTAADGGPGVATPPPAGPTNDLLESLRPEARAQIAGWIGVHDIGELSLYDIDLQADPDAGSFTATERIDFSNRTGQALTEVALRVYGNEFGKQGEPAPVTLLSAAVGGAPVELRQPGPTTYAVVLPAPLAAGARATIEIRFAGQAPRQEAGQTGMLRQGIDMLKDLLGAGGGGIEGYGILSVGDDILSLASWYPVVARWYADTRQWDLAEPNGIGDVGTEDLANYRVRVRVPGRAVIASSGVQLDAGAEPTDLTFGGAALRDFTVLVSRSYVVAARDVAGTKVSVYVPQGRQPFAERILDYAVAALEIYERRFGPYTLTELDVAAAPLIGGAGGVEFPGIVTVATMLLQNLSESLGALAPAGLDRLPILDEMVEFVVAHEVAHQWWNGMIGSDSVRHPYIDEGMAQYSSVLYFEERYGAERAARTADRNVKLNYLVYRLLGNADGAVDRATGDFSGPLEYAALVYGKGPYFWQAVRTAIGDEAFGRALHAYYDAYRYKVAGPTAFAEIAGRIAGRPAELAALQRHWLEETHGDEDLGRATLGQLVQMVMGDSPELQQLLGGLGGDGGSGGDLSGILRLLQGAGGAADGGTAPGPAIGTTADGGAAADPSGVLSILQAMQQGGADGGVAPGAATGDPGAAPLGRLLGLARRMLEPLAQNDPDLAHLLDLLDRLQRGEPVDPAALLAAAQRALQSLAPLLGDQTGGMAGQLLDLLGGLPDQPVPGAPRGPLGRPGPDAGLPASPP